MNKKSSLVVFIMIISLCFAGFQKEASAASEPIQFNDLNSVTWAWDGIYYLAGKKVVNGYGNGKYGPKDAVTRGQAAAILVRELYPSVSPTGSSLFSDVQTKHSFYNEIMIASEKEIFQGFPGGIFKPDEPITRAQAARILAIAYDIKTGKTPIQFSDLGKAAWAKEHILLLSSNKIINGYPGGTFKPNQNVNRAEFSQMLATTLVHKNPSIWVTPKPGSANGYIPVQGKTYGFTNTDGSGSYTLSYRGVNEQKQPVWDQRNKDGTIDEMTYEETTEMAVSMFFSDRGSIVLGLNAYLVYPVFVGKTWNESWLLMGMFDKPQILSAITSTSETIVTPAGTFQNVVEVTRGDGITYYVAKGIGMIMAKVDGKKVFEITSIK